MRRLLFLVPAVLSAACATVQHPDHVGIHFAADVGAVGSRSEASSGGNSVSISGGGATFAVAGGGAIAPNLILGAQIWATSVSDPKISDDYNGSGTATDSTYGVVGFGPMLKYYLMPANVYFAATPGVAKLTFTDPDDNRGETRWGPALRAAVGKEWGVGGGAWGLGVAGVLDVASTKDKGSGAPSWKTVAGGVVFSVSLN